MELIFLAVIILITIRQTSNYYNKKNITIKNLNLEIKEKKDSLSATTNKLTTKKSELDKLVIKLDSAKSEFYIIDKNTKELQELKVNADEISKTLNRNTNLIKTTKEKLATLNNTIKNKNTELNNLIKKIDIYQNLDEYICNGIYETPKYLFETSARYAEEIKKIRKNQKELIKSKKAIIYSDSITISGNKIYDKKILNGQYRLMLTAFNLECDELIGSVRPSTYTKILERIENLADELEKSSASLRCGFNIDYVKLKYEECRLQYQFTLKKKEEQEEQRLIREQIREEQKAIREYEKAIAQAEKEEKMYRSLLEKAKKQLLKASNDERIISEQKIERLEYQLAEIKAKEERAKSMAEQTKKGHVYVISNIGSFGEDIYKIGLTRRIEPLERVKELSSASVPFSFDVHALIYSDDAPALEASLHRALSQHRVNAVNTRKEFFHVDLQKIKKSVQEISGSKAEFIMTCLAEEFNETRRLRQVNQKVA